MPTPRKAERISEVSELLRQSLVAVVTEYRGMSVSEITDLRRKLRPTGTEYHVTKNTLVQRAAAELGFGNLEELLAGPTAMAFVREDLQGGIKSLLDYQKNSKVFVVKAGILGGKVVTGDRLEALTKLPTKNDLIAKMMGSLNAPATNLVSVLSATPRNLVTALDAIPRNLVNVLNQRKLQLEPGS